MDKSYLTPRFHVLAQTKKDKFFDVITFFFLFMFEMRGLQNWLYYRDNVQKEGELTATLMRCTS